jgi:hypothetical protein
MSTEREYVCDDCGDYWEAGDMLIPGYLMDDRAVDAATALAASEARAAALEPYKALADAVFGPEPWVDWSELGIKGVGRIDCKWCHGRKPEHRDDCIKPRYDSLSTPTPSPATDEAQGEA